MAPRLSILIFALLHAETARVRLMFGLVMGSLLSLCYVSMVWQHVGGEVGKWWDRVSGSNAAQLFYLDTQRHFNVATCLLEMVFWLASLALQIQHAPEKTFWLIWAASVGKFAGEAVFRLAQSSLLLSRCWLMGVGRNSQDQIDQRREREAEPELTKKEEDELCRHNVYTIMQLTLYIGIGIAFTTVFWIFLWPSYQYIDGCWNTDRMIALYIAEMSAIFCWLVPGCWLVGRPAVKFSANTNAPPFREYLIVNTFKIVCCRVLIELLFSAIEVWGLLDLVKDSMSRSTFWLAWAGAVMGNIGLIADVFYLGKYMPQDYRPQPNQNYI